ncbi:MAG: hypothetical protein ACC612_09120 [Methanomethylovorans sp.]|uniref:hypothetical protein n=1 Tax=Methanomethylovorans sp. TaxID=2758717 RepID=UPI0035310094
MQDYGTKDQIYTLQNNTIKLLLSAQKEAREKLDQICQGIKGEIPVSQRQSLFLFPFADTVNLSDSIDIMIDRFINQIILLESKENPALPVDLKDVFNFAKKLPVYDAFQVAEYVLNTYLQNNNNAMKRIKADCQKLIPLNGSRYSSDRIEVKNDTVINLKASGNLQDSTKCVESLLKMVDVVIHSIEPLKAQRIRINPGESYLTDDIRLYFFKNRKIRLVFKNPEYTRKFITVLQGADFPENNVHISERQQLSIASYSSVM